jgi:hypothetical protein
VRFSKVSFIELVGVVVPKDFESTDEYFEIVPE